MTDEDLERRLRNWYRAEIGEAERAPTALRTSVAAIPHAWSPEVRMPWRFSTMPMPTRVAAAAVIAVLAVGGAFYLARPSQPAVVGGPTPTPGPSASPSEPASPSAVPSPSVISRAPSWTATGSLVTPGGGPATLLHDGKVLVAGVAGALYDPATGTWTATRNVVAPRQGPTATLLPSGKVLVAGGGDFSGRDLASGELYDPATGRWTATGRMTTPRAGHTATLLPDGKVLVAGGWSNAPRGGTVASAELYDPATGRWTATRSMGAPRAGHTATLLPDGKVLVAGGVGGGTLASAALYDPATGRWTATGRMGTPRVGHTATLLPGGKVLVAGGGFTASAELFDPVTGSWAATGTMGTPRQTHTATLLTDGKVLATGGWQFGGPGGLLASAELYDPGSGTWTFTASMSMPRAGTATLLPDGRVLVQAGSPGPDQSAPDSAELYDPGSP